MACRARAAECTDSSSGLSCRPTPNTPQPSSACRGIAILPQLPPCVCVCLSGGKFLWRNALPSRYFLGEGNLDIVAPLLTNSCADLLQLTRTLVCESKSLIIVTSCTICRKYSEIIDIVAPDLMSILECSHRLLPSRGLPRAGG